MLSLIALLLGGAHGRLGADALGTPVVQPAL